jgi:hypothetical protein
MSNGTSGNINNIDFGEGKQEKLPPYGRIRVVADNVAKEVLRVLPTVKLQDSPSLAAVQKEIALKVRKPTPDELAKAKEVVSRAKTFPRMNTQEEIYARETVQMADYPDNVKLILQTLRIGDLTIHAIPCEVFVEIGLELKRKTPTSFTVSLANGYNGYLPTPEHHALGGYETWRAKSSYLEVEGSRKIKETLAELLNRLPKN